MTNTTRSVAMLLLYCLVALVAGCSTTVAPMQTTFSAPQQVIDKNYTIGEAKTAYVGDPVVKVKDYYVKKGTQNRLRASNGFTITGIQENILAQKDQEFNVVGTTRRDGVLCYVTAFPSSGVLWPIKSTGEFCGRALNPGPQGYVEMIYTYKIDPPETRFELVTAETVDSTAGFTNFELIYTGKNAQSLNFQYREYTPNDMARPAYSQALTYSADSKTVRFKKIRIGIDEATDEKLVYKVLEDDGSQ